MRIIFIAIIGLFSIWAGAKGNHSKENVNQKQYWLKFKAKDKYERTQLADLGFTIESIVEDNVYSIGTEEQLKIAKGTGKLEQHFVLNNSMLDFPSYDSEFHNYAELTNALHKLQDDYPEVVRLTSIGSSLEGRALHLITLSAVEDDTSLPAVIFMGGHHAREHVSVEMPLQLAQHLAAEYAAGTERVVDLLNTRTVYIVPLVNPDGAEHDVRTGNYKLWRKNRRANSNGTFGVDLNRNYGFGWGGGGASTSPSHDTFRGSSAFSEPESRAIKNFVESHDNITTLLSFHTFSELVLYPWGHKYDSIEDNRALKVHETMANKMASWNGYTPQQSSELYIASGDTTDWSYGELGIISFTFELDPKASPDMNFNPGKGFYPGQKFIKPVFEKNLEPCLYLIEYSDNPYRVIEPAALSFGLSSALF